MELRQLEGPFLDLMVTTELPDLSKYSSKQLHGMGSDAREKDKHLEALQYLDHAIVGYQKENNYKGLIDALKDRTLTWKHYFLLTKDNVYAILAQKDAESMLAITKDKKLQDKLSTSHFRLGEIAMLSENYTSAIDSYKKALQYYNGPLSEKGDFRYHLGEAIYRNGQKTEGKSIILQGLKEIQEGADELDPFLIHVWESGVHMRLADILREDEPKEAKKHLEMARTIVETDEKLVIRRRQIKELSEAFEN
jgi:tetratricopeptide (TPR) repeat protein